MHDRQYLQLSLDVLANLLTLLDDLGVRANEEKGHRPKNRAKDEKSEATFLQGSDHRRMCYMSNTPIVKYAEKNDILVEQPRLTEVRLQPIYHIALSIPLQKGVTLANF